MRPVPLSKDQEIVPAMLLAQLAKKEGAYLGCNKTSGQSTITRLSGKASFIFYRSITMNVFLTWLSFVLGHIFTAKSPAH